MEREKLIAQIKLILLDPYFPISERNKWEILIPKMSDEDLEELFENLKLKTKALFEVDTTLYELGKTCEANLNIDEEIDKEARKYPFQDLSQENLILLFGQKLLPWLEKDFDIKADIEAYFSFAADPDLGKKLLEALATNEELIGKNSIIKLMGLELKPTISNWIKDYEEKVGNKPERILARAEYLSSSPNILKVSSSDKEKIKKIIELYDFLKFPFSLLPLPGVTFPLGVIPPPTFPSVTPKPPLSTLSKEKKEPIKQKPEEKPRKPSMPSPTLEKKPSPKSPEPSSFEQKYLEESDVNKEE